MAALLAAIAGAIAEFGLDAVIAFLVEQGILPAWMGGEEDVARESTPYAIQEHVAAIRAQVESFYSGLAAINTRVMTLNTDQQQVVNAIEALSVQVAALPVPPTGGDNASAVWEYRAFEGDETTWQHLSWIERYAALTSQYGSWPWHEDPNFAVSGSFKYPPD
jgi:hypothetical protein